MYKAETKKSSLVSECARILRNIGREKRRARRDKRRIKPRMLLNRLLRYRHYSRIPRHQRYKVVFMVINVSTWKLDALYHQLLASGFYEVTIVTVPLNSLPEYDIKRNLEVSYQFFVERGYNVVNSYCASQNRYLDVRKDLNPDVVFFTNSHAISNPEYCIENFSELYTCYVPYSFRIDSLIDLQFNSKFHNIVWRNFYETNVHYEIARHNALNKGRNVSVVGYPALEELTKHKNNFNNVWKIKDDKIKRIIWAPHQTIPEHGADLDWSCFLLYADFMLELLKKYEGMIQVAFKPHPFLKRNLSHDNVWGEKKTLEYFEQWEMAPNGQLNEEDYFDLFLGSDAMIHDSGSFMVEYLVLNKPVLYTLRDRSVTDRFNEFGKLAFEEHYLAKNKDNILEFVEDVVLNEEDPMRERRGQFVENNITVKGMSPSLAIVDFLNNTLNISS